MPDTGGLGRIDARVLEGLTPIIRAAGVDPEEAERRAGFADAALRPDERSIRLSQFVRFLETAGDLSRDPAFMWRCGRRYSTVGVSELLPDLRPPMALGGLLVRLVDAVNRVQSDSIVRLSVADGLAAVEYRVLDPSVWPRSRDVEFTFGFFDGIVKSYAGPDFRPELVAFEHEADHRSAAVQRCIGAVAIHGRPCNLLALPASLLNLAPPPGSPLLRPAAGGGIAMSVAPEADLRALMRVAILSRIGEGDLSQAAIAACCGLSERTLRRRLGEAGIGFRGEVDRLRMLYARQMLANTGLPLGELAQRLGYTQQPDFTRAFRRMHGVTPQAFRRSTRAG